MASKTPTVVRESFGSLTAHIATFSDIDLGDYWASAIPGILAVIPCNVDQALTWANFTCCFTASNGTIWFQTGVDNRASRIIVLSKS